MSSLRYGYVEIDKLSDAKTFTIKNRGQKHLKITSVSIGGPLMQKDSVTISPTASSLAGRILAPDESVVVTARVEPKDFGTVTIELLVSARGLTEADAISAGIDSEFISPSWSKSATLPIQAIVSNGDASFYELDGSTALDTSYDFGRINSRGLYQRYVRVKKVSGSGPVIINGWGTSYTSAGLAVTTGSVSLPVRLSNVGDYRDFVITLEPTAAAEIHTCIASFDYYELGKSKTHVYAMYGSSEPQQLSFYAYGKNPGEAYNHGTVGVQGGSTYRKGVVCTVENNGDIPLNILDTWITTSSTGSGSRSKTLSLGNIYGSWSIASDIEGIEVPPGLTRAFIVWVENPNSTSSTATNAIVEVYAFVQTDSDTNPMQKIKIIAEIVR